jgi:hypothetical protein
MSGPSVISVDSSPGSPADTDPGVPVHQTCEPEPRSRPRSPSIDSTLVQLSPAPRASRAPHSPAPSLVPPPPSPILWWAEAPASPPSSPPFWWAEPLGVPPALASTRVAFSPNAASASDRCPPLHLSSISACSAPSAQASSGRCPPLQLPCVSASSASSVLDAPVARAAPQPPRSLSSHPDPLLVNVVPLSLSTAWVPERCIVDNARFKRGLVVLGSRINWPLTLPPFGAPLNDSLHYAVGECKRLIGEGRDYYIGATRDPYDRFWGWEAHKHHHTWRNMWVVCQSTNIGIRRLETELIDADIGRAHPLCANKAPGGGGIPKAASPLTPYFVYIVDTLD